jgi:hypothetical protein
MSTWPSPPTTTTRLFDAPGSNMNDCRIPLTAVRFSKPLKPRPATLPEFVPVLDPVAALRVFAGTAALIVGSPLAMILAIPVPVTSTVPLPA